MNPRRILQIGRELDSAALLALRLEEPFKESCLLQLEQQALLQFPESALMSSAV